MSKYKEVETLIEQKVSEINTSIVFHTGQFSEINLSKQDKDSIVWLLPMSSNGSFTNNDAQNNRTFSVFIYVFKKSKPDDLRTQYMPIIHQADQILEDIVTKVMESEPEEGTLEVTSYNTEPVIKFTANYLTGCILRMNITTSDNYKCDCR